MVGYHETKYLSFYLGPEQVPQTLFGLVARLGEHIGAPARDEELVDSPGLFGNKVAQALVSWLSGDFFPVPDHASQAASFGQPRSTSRLGRAISSACFPHRAKPPRPRRSALPSGKRDRSRRAGRDARAARRVVTTTRGLGCAASVTS